MSALKEQSAALSKSHIASFGKVVQLRRENQDLIEYAHRFYRGQWAELMECVHCVSDKHLDTQSNRARIRELVAEQERIISGLKALVA
jgi:hypothetical protein